MARYIHFDKAFMQRVRNEVDLLSLIGQEISLKKIGRNYAGLCPFHQEKTASFHVDPGKKAYRCYACQAKGNAINWLRERHHMSFYEAVVHIAHLLGLPLPTANQPSQENRQQRERFAGLYRANQVALQFYRHGIKKSAEARHYLETVRGLTAETISRFELGVVGKGIIELLGKHTAHSTLVESGLAAEREGCEVYDRFRHRIMIPIHNESGSLIGFAGRTLLNNEENNPKYLNSPETAIFHKGRELYGLDKAKLAIRKAKLAICVEGYFDVISLHQAGDERAIAPMGTAITAHQLRRLLNYADTVVFAYDGDAAGRKAAISTAMMVLEALKDGQQIKFLTLPEGEDPDTFIRSKGLPSWDEALETAIPLSQFLCDVVSSNLNRDLPESQMAAGKIAQGVLNRIEQAVLFKRAMAMKFEKLIGIPLHGRWGNGDEF
jgi:DNA primase